jgi:hypothetical protein
MNPNDNHNRQERAHSTEATARRIGGLALVAELGLLVHTESPESEATAPVAESAPVVGNLNPAEADAARALVKQIHDDNTGQTEAPADNPHTAAAQAAQEFLNAA